MPLVHAVVVSLMVGVSPVLAVEPVSVPQVAPQGAPNSNPDQIPALKPDADAMIAKAVAYLRAQQDAKTGGWAVPPQGPVFPAITGLVLNGMLLDPSIKHTDPSVARGIKFILSYQQPDGGIYDNALPSYNTSISLVALAMVPTPEAKAAIKPAQEFLRSLQYGEGAIEREGAPEAAKIVGKDHPFYGGTGYGRHGRPDLSNTAWCLEGLAASGVDSSDPAFQRALVFLQRIQMLEKTPDGTIVNDMPYAKGSRQGGFVYATSENKDKVGSGQSNAANIEETLDDGTKVSRLRAYGSMTYSGFKSYLYAGLSKNDPRVLAAMDWISRNYTLEENPGVGTDGLYYYFVVFGKAMKASATDVIDTVKPDGSRESRRWADDLIARLFTLQNEDGSFRSVDDRWMENNPVLITAYSLVALQHARNAR